MSLRWLHFAVLGPLVLLASLAWWGTRMQLKAAWTEAREQSERIIPEIEETISTRLEERLTELPDVPDPPKPGSVAQESDRILDGTDLRDLETLRDDPGAGVSPAGLPRRAIAALRIHELDPGRQATLPRTYFVNLFTKQCPSVLTTRALETFRCPPEEIARWKESLRIIRAARLTGESSGWLGPQGPQCIAIHFRIKESKLQVARLEYDPKIESFPGLPSGAKVIVGQEPFSPSAFPVVASMPVRLGRGMNTYIQIPPKQLEASIRRQQRWTFALLAVAVATAGGALFAIHRTVSRERRLADLKSQFVSSVSHELRAPLGSIRLMAEALQQEKVARPAEFHALIAREGARLSHLIENVLDFARIEDGRKRYHFEETDLTALIRDTLSVMQPLAHDRGVRIESDLDDCLANVDPGAIQQALVNLLDNAIKFSPEGSTVAVASSRLATPSSIQITITDHGPGIAEKDHAAIFERFHRLGNELRRETQGTGIGLSIVKHIAEAHGGMVTVESRPGHGATFTLTLPDTPCES